VVGSVLNDKGRRTLLLAIAYGGASAAISLDHSCRDMPVSCQAREASWMAPPRPATTCLTRAPRAPPTPLVVGEPEEEEEEEEEEEAVVELEEDFEEEEEVEIEGGDEEDEGASSVAAAAAAAAASAAAFLESPPPTEGGSTEAPLPLPPPPPPPLPSPCSCSCSSHCFRKGSRDQHCSAQRGGSRPNSK